MIEHGTSKIYQIQMPGFRKHKIIDYVETGEYCYLIMEYIKGQSLGELLRSGKRFSLREILALGKEIARVLEYLHSRKPPVCYGDLKPDNLMFSETGHLYLIDLGLMVKDVKCIGYLIDI